MPLAVKAQSPNHWAAREYLLEQVFLNVKYFLNVGGKSQNLFLCICLFYSFIEVEINFFNIFIGV